MWLALAACSQPASEPATPSPPLAKTESARPALGKTDGAAVARTASEKIARLATSANTIDEYKRAAGMHILEVNRDRVMPGVPQALLRAVIVVRVHVGADGRATVEILRSSDAALSKTTVESMRRADPLPNPPARLARELAKTGYTETWLYNTDGRFHLRTLAPPQANE